MNQYEETEQLAVDEKKKRLHYERIRTKEDREEINTLRETLSKEEAAIDEKVYDDTQDQQTQKHRLDNQIVEIDKEIEQLEK